MRKVIISLAPIPGPAAPIHVNEIAEDIIKSIDAGASMCHLHSKDLNGVLSPDISVLGNIFDTVRKSRDVVVQVSTGGISNMNIEERCNPLKYPEAESASLKWRFHKSWRSGIYKFF